MSPTHQPVRRLAEQLRHNGANLLEGLPDLHDELMSLVWGPRFDREHALGLVARRPQLGVQVLPALLSAAETFDSMQAASQRRVRELIRRHRALTTAAARPTTATWPAPSMVLPGNCRMDAGIGHGAQSATALAHPCVIHAGRRAAAM
ncbi:hypothetical protein BSY15_3163 [Acidovorax sp. RAC01]|nr:hypothetical protein BSY15_3163 [Acidovorax sp. RAC01]